MPPRFNGLWRHRDFVRLWTGETISVFGSLIGQMAMQFTAIIWLHASALASQRARDGAARPRILRRHRRRRLGRPPAPPADPHRRRRRPRGAITSVPLAAVFGVLDARAALRRRRRRQRADRLLQRRVRGLPAIARQRRRAGRRQQQAAGNRIDRGVRLVQPQRLARADPHRPGRAADRCGVVHLLRGFRRRASARPEPPRVREEHERQFWREAHEGLRLVAGNPLLRSFAVAKAMRELLGPHHRHRDLCSTCTGRWASAPACSA